MRIEPGETYRWKPAFRDAMFVKAIEDARSRVEPVWWCIDTDQRFHACAVADLHPARKTVVFARAVGPSSRRR